MSRRVNILAVLIVLGTSVPNVPIVILEDDGGDGSGTGDPETLTPGPEAFPAAATVPALP